MLWIRCVASIKGMPMNAPARPNPLRIPTTWCSVQWSYIFLCLLICFMDIFFILFTFSSLFISCYSFNHRIIIIVCINCCCCVGFFVFFFFIIYEEMTMTSMKYCIENYTFKLISVTECLWYDTWNSYCLFEKNKTVIYIIANGWNLYLKP